MQSDSNQDLADIEQSISSQFLWSEEKEAGVRKDVEELKKKQECIITHNSKHIEELKKDQGWLVFEKAHIWDSRVRLEEAVFDAC